MVDFKSKDLLVCKILYRSWVFTVSNYMENVFQSGQT